MSRLTRLSSSIDYADEQNSSDTYGVKLLWCREWLTSLQMPDTLVAGVASIEFAVHGWNIASA